MPTYYSSTFPCYGSAEPLYLSNAYIDQALVNEDGVLVRHADSPENDLSPGYVELPTSSLGLETLWVEREEDEEEGLFEQLDTHFDPFFTPEKEPSVFECEKKREVFCKDFFVENKYFDTRVFLDDVHYAPTDNLLELYNISEHRGCEFDQLIEETRQHFLHTPFDIFRQSATFDASIFFKAFEDAGIEVESVAKMLYLWVIRFLPTDFLLFMGPGARRMRTALRRWWHPLSETEFGYAPILCNCDTMVKNLKIAAKKSNRFNYVKIPTVDTSDFTDDFLVYAMGALVKRGFVEPTLIHFDNSYKKNKRHFSYV